MCKSLQNVSLKDYFITHVDLRKICIDYLFEYTTKIISLSVCMSYCYKRDSSHSSCLSSGLI